MTGSSPRARVAVVSIVTPVVDTQSVVAVERETARYYDAEVGREERRLDPRRVAARERFAEVVAAAGPEGPVLEVGTGPGRDTLALVEAGLDVIGADLSEGHAARAASKGLTMAVASARALPLKPSSIGAMWSMSTLMHIPSVAIGDVMQELARVLAPGGVVAIGVWGGPDVEHFSDRPADQPLAPRRLFSRRSPSRWQSLLEVVGRIDEFEVWESEAEGSDAFRYYFAFLTAH